MPGASGEVTPPLQIALAFLLSLLKATGAGLLEHLTWSVGGRENAEILHSFIVRVHR